jgi:hypothetical protein
VVVKKLKTYFLIGITIFLLLSAGQNYLQSKRITEFKSEVQRLEKNIKELSAQNQQQTALVLTQKELTGKYLAERDSLAKLLKIRPKTIIKYVDKIITQVERDTVEVESEWLKDLTWKLTDTGDCFRWEADAELDGLDLNVNRTLFDYKNGTTDIFYWQRKKVLFFRIGKKQFFQKSIPKCGTTFEKSIEIIKK